MTDLYDALEDCLQKLEQGSTLDAAIADYPELAAELYPLLEVSLQARKAGHFTVPEETRRRARARLLQHASQLRETRRKSRSILPFWPRLALAFGIVAILIFLSGTALVKAASGALPGELLYPVKRTWETLRLELTLDAEKRALMESQLAQERLDEVNELLKKGESAQIEFSGLLIERQGEWWQVSGISILVTPSTQLPTETIANGTPIMVIGRTRADGIVEAFKISILPPGAWLPPLQPSEKEQEEPIPVPTSPSLVSPTPQSEEGEDNDEDEQPETYQFSGIIEWMRGNVWNINGQIVYVDNASISGQAVPGAFVEFEGYYDANGKFIVTKVEVKEAPAGNSGKEGQSGSENDNGGEKSGPDDQEEEDNGENGEE